MTDGAAQAHRKRANPQDGRHGSGPGPGQDQGGEAECEQAGVDLRRYRALLARHLRAHDLVGGVGQQLQHRPQQSSKREVITAGTNDDQRARKAQHHQRPAQAAHRLLEPQRGDQRHRNRRHRHNRRELGQRQVAQAHHRAGIAHTEQQPAGDLKAPVRGVKDVHAIAAGAEADREDALQAVPQPQRHEDRYQRTHKFGAGVQHRERSACAYGESDAGENCGGSGGHCRARRAAWHWRLRVPTGDGSDGRGGTGRGWIDGLIIKICALLRVLAIPIWQKIASDSR